MILFLTMLAFPLIADPEAIKTKYGVFAFKELSLQTEGKPPLEKQSLCGTLDNQTGRSWRQAYFWITISGRSMFDSSKRSGVRLRVILARAPDGASKFCVPSGYVPKTDSFDQTVAEFSFGDIDPTPEQQRIAAQSAEKRRLEEKEHQDYISTLPTLDSGGSATFLASDRKCAEQFAEAHSMEGLEKRKRIAELVTFHCGISVDSREKAEVLQKQGNYAAVKIITGSKAGSSGWVPIAWIKTE